MGPSDDSTNFGASGSGLLSNVFGFFSREIESFVVNAAGGSVKQPPEPGPSSSPRRVKKKSTRVKDTVYISPPNTVRGKDPRKDKRKSRPATRERSHRIDKPDVPHKQNEPEFLKPPSPIHREKAFLKPPLPTMPGSLFPRSPSMIPEFAAPPQTQRIQHVSNYEPSHILEQICAVGTNGCPTPEYQHAEADISSEEDGLSPPKLSAKAKGKQRAVEPPFDRDPGETTTEYVVRGKEWELVNVLESHKTAEERLQGFPAAEDRERIELERDRDKERIRILEQEVAHLRRELERRKVSDPNPRLNPQSRSTMMPPPPPPPPPAFDSAPPVRLPVSSSRTTEEFLSSARAALKHTILPVEAPINSAYAPSTTKRTGQPTVNLGGDKMAAFLNEMKSVKLRKTGSLASIRSVGAEAEQEATSATLKRRLSAAGAEARNKRQRTYDPTLGVPFSKPQGQLTALHAPFDHPSTSRQDPPLLAHTRSSPKEVRALSPASSSTLLPSTIILPNVQPNPLTHGSFSTDNTPSLCSDHEPSQANSTEDRLPVTPPHAHRLKSKGLLPPVQKPAEVIVITDSPPALTRFATKRSMERRRSVDVSEIPPPIALSMPITAPLPVGPPTSKRFLSRRIPSSPMPQVQTPKRPSRPAKSRVVPVQPRAPVNFSDDELEYASDNDDNPLYFLNEKSFAGTTPYLKPATGILPNGHGRRKTLDEEIRSAEDDGLFDSGVLVGVGTRSKKRGFLKGGGGAGTPVHAGVGHVIGAEGSEDEQPSDHQTVGDVEEELNLGRRIADATADESTDDEDERLLAGQPSAVLVRKGQISKRSWLPVPTTTTGSTAGLRGWERGNK